ncbi:trigger factor family protein, partial [Lactococcus lactis]
MTVSFEKTSDTKGTLSFSIDQETIKTGLDKAFNKVKANISVPGFRKGKISRQMFNKMYGEEALFEEPFSIFATSIFGCATGSIPASFTAA